MRLSTISSTYRTNENRFGIDFKQMSEDGYSGFDYQEFGDIRNDIYKMNIEDFKEFMTSLKEEASKYGISCLQLHSAWPTDDSTMESREDSLKYYERSILGASLMSCPNVVIHHRLPGEIKGDDYEGLKRVNVEFLKKLMPSCEKYGVNLCLENLPFRGSKIFTVDGTMDIVNAVNNERMMVCLDTGHQNVWSEKKIYDDVLSIGDKLGCLHIHDNRGDDTHCLPFFYSIDFNELIRGLKDIHYHGVLNTEPTLPHGVNEKVWRAHQILLSEIIKYIDELMTK